MAKLPATKKLVIEDYPEAKKWIEKLLQPLNGFMESVTNALNRGLTFRENLDAQISDVEVVGAGFPFSFKVTTRSRPIGCFPVALRVKETGAATPLPSITWVYSPSSGLIELSAATGLTNGTKYILTLVVITG